MRLPQQIMEEEIILSTTDLQKKYSILQLLKDLSFLRKAALSLL